VHCRFMTSSKSSATLTMLFRVSLAAVPPVFDTTEIPHPHPAPTATTIPRARVHRIRRRCHGLRGAFPEADDLDYRECFEGCVKEELAEARGRPGGAWAGARAGARPRPRARAGIGRGELLRECECGECEWDRWRRTGYLCGAELPHRSAVFGRRGEPGRGAVLVSEERQRRHGVVLSRRASWRWRWSWS
jgi:hypothetical protein